MGHQFTVEEKNKEAYFIRIPKDMYNAIKEAAENNDRSIQLQSHILLGAALNRDLINPSQMVYNASSEAEPDVVSELHRQIEFLQNVIDTLAKGKRDTVITYTPTLPNYVPYWRPSPNIVWASGTMKSAVGGNVSTKEFTNYSGASFSVDTSKLLA